MPRIGIGFVTQYSSTHEMLDYAKLAERSGFESVWVAEHLFFRDAFSSLAAIALETRRVGLSTAIVNIYSRNPVQMAMNVATINELSNGRAMLGIGTGDPDALLKIGARMREPVVGVREYARIVRDLLAGKAVTHEGEIFRVRDAKLHMELSSRHIPIYVAAVRSKMLQLAGEMFDGVIFPSMSSCQYIRRALEEIRIGAERAGRKLADVDVASMIMTSVSSDSKRAKAAARETPSYLRFLSREDRGVMMLGPEYRDQLNLVREALREGDVKSVSRQVTDDMVDLVTVSGTPEECKERLKEYVSTGVSLPIIVPAPGSDFAAAMKTFT